MPLYNHLEYGMYQLFLNHWLLTGNTRSKCFLVQTGGFYVTFSGEQILKGTYGGEEGIDTPSNANLAYFYTCLL